MALFTELTESTPRQGCIAQDVQAVITSFNQKHMIEEAVQSLLQQTLLPSKIVIVDDGSQDVESLAVLSKFERCTSSVVPIIVVHKDNGGVSSARNQGIQVTDAPFVLILDGDDHLEESYIEKVSQLLRQTPNMVAASSWIKTFGVLNSVVCPHGGSLEDFLPRNACPATHILRKKAWVKCGGYDENMRSGFEDWEFFLQLLETKADACIGIVEQPLIDYRTAPVSANIQSMNKRLELMRYIIEKHMLAYQQHLTAALLGLETISMQRMQGWESEIISAQTSNRDLCSCSAEFLKSPSYGDGGMAAAVRIVSAVTKQEQSN